MHDQFPSSDNLQVALESFSLVMQNSKLQAIIGQKEQMTWVCSAINTIHQLLTSSKQAICTLSGHTQGVGAGTKLSQHHDTTNDMQFSWRYSV